MYSYSHTNDGGWLGQFDRPSDCLIAGRAIYGDDSRIYVARWKQAHYSELFIGSATLMSYMREDAEGKDIGTDAFDNLSPEQLGELDQYLRDAIGEWEAELPDEMQSSGAWVEMVRSYAQGEEVRSSHFPK